MLAKIKYVHVEVLYISQTQRKFIFYCDSPSFSAVLKKKKEKKKKKNEFYIISHK